MLGLVSAIAYLLAGVNFVAWGITGEPTFLILVLFGIGSAIVFALWDIEKQNRKGG